MQHDKSGTPPLFLYAILENTRRVLPWKHMFVNNVGKNLNQKQKDRITFCSRECAFDFKHDHIKPKIKPEPKKIECVCVICGKRFENNRRCKLCSNECRKELARRKTYKHNYESKALKPHRCKECGLEIHSRIWQ